MDELEKKSVHKYFDPETGFPLKIYLGKYFMIVDRIEMNLKGVPLLINNESEEIYFPELTKHMIKSFVSEAKKNGKSGIDLSPRTLGERRYSYSENIKFKYSQIDYEYIPGLMRPENDGFLTPVFFNLSVLNKYSQHPEYRLNLFSETYGNIEAKDWIISFGINESKKIIIWLGDVDSLSEEEKYYLRSENIESDHDIHSEFYDAQIGVIFSEPSRKKHLFHIRQELNEKSLKYNGFPLFVLEGEVSRIIESLDRPVFWEEKHISPIIESFNRIFVESINIKSLKNEINNSYPDVDLKSKASLKICQKWLEKCLSSGDHSGIMSSFYVLNDFRILVCHLLPDSDRKEKLRYVNERLGIDSENTNNEIIFDSLIEKLILSISEINELINC